MKERFYLEFERKILFIKFYTLVAFNAGHTPVYRRSTCAGRLLVVVCVGLSGMPERFSVNLDMVSIESNDALAGFNCVTADVTDSSFCF